MLLAIPATYMCGTIIILYIHAGCEAVFYAMRNIFADEGIEGIIIVSIAFVLLF